MWHPKEISDGTPVGLDSLAGRYHKAYEGTELITVHFRRLLDSVHLSRAELSNEVETVSTYDTALR